MQLSLTYLIKRCNCYQTIFMALLLSILVNLLWHLHTAILEWKESTIMFFHLSLNLPIKKTRLWWMQWKRSMSCNLKLNNIALRTRIAISRSTSLHYLKTRYKRVHQMNSNLVNVLSNLSTAMCHAFITN